MTALLNLGKGGFRGRLGSLSRLRPFSLACFQNRRPQRVLFNPYAKLGAPGLLDCIDHFNGAFDGHGRIRLEKGASSPQPSPP
jgi:hypothetical protein